MEIFGISKNEVIVISTKWSRRKNKIVKKVKSIFAKKDIFDF